MLAKYFVDEKSNATVSSDGDFLMHTEAKCIFAKGTNYVNKTKTVKSLTSSTSSNETANLWLSQLNQMSASVLNLKLAQFPFFYAHDDFKTRVLITMCLGYDAHQGGCNNAGLSKLNDHVKN